MHLIAGSLIHMVFQLDLTAFCKAYDVQGMGNAAYDPAVMTALRFYSYCLGERSSRKIEKSCLENSSGSFFLKCFVRMIERLRSI